MSRSSGTVVDRRRDRMARLVRERGHAVVADLAEVLGVSEMTVRRDIAVLGDQGRVIAFHGGVRSTPFDAFPSTFGRRMTVEAQVKERIALRAAGFVGHSPCAIAIDAGSTTGLLARTLAGTAGLRVVTASVPVVAALADTDGIDVVVLGGTLRRETQSFVGPRASAAARDIQVETYFLGAAGLSTRGAFDVTDLDAVVKRELIHGAKRVVAMADATKFGRRALSKICGWESIHTLITDDRIEPASVAMLEEVGVELIVVDSTG